MTKKQALNVSWLLYIKYNVAIRKTDHDAYNYVAIRNFFDKNIPDHKTI